MKTLHKILVYGAFAVAGVKALKNFKNKPDVKPTPAPPAKKRAVPTREDLEESTRRAIALARASTPPPRKTTSDGEGEESAIIAAREYIAKHMSMRPGTAVQASLQEEDQRLEKRLTELRRSRSRRTVRPSSSYSSPSSTSDANIAATNAAVTAAVTTVIISS